MKKIDQIVSDIKKMFPDISGVKAIDDSIFLGDCAEGGTICGLPACDYYAEGALYPMGVYYELNDLLEGHGWFVECHDPGTYYAYEA